MKFSTVIVQVLISGAAASSVRRGHGRSLEDTPFTKAGKSDASKAAKIFKGKSSKEEATTEGPSSVGGMNTTPVHIAGYDNSVRLLKREGIIDSIPTSICEKNRDVEEGAEPVHGKNVILVVGEYCNDTLCDTVSMMSVVIFSRSTTPINKSTTIFSASQYHQQVTVWDGR